MINYNNFINEGKFWYKTIPQLLEWLESNQNRTWIYLDLETTGLDHPSNEQITQVAGISTSFNFDSTKFTEKSSFNKKIKLTEDIKRKMNDPKSRIKWVLSFNHYGNGKKYFDENDVLVDFKKWISQYDKSVFVIQNAGFDMKFLNVRASEFKFDNEVFDTKAMIQLFYLPLLLTLAETDEKYQQMVDNIGTSDRDNGLISSSMSKVGPALGLDMTNYHDGLQDCKITIKMTEKIIDFLKQHQDVDIRKYQLERIRTK